MVRNISPNGLATIANPLGNEPIFILSVDWSADNAPVSYADRDLQVGTTFIAGKIVDIGEIDNTVDISGSNNSQEVSVTLDDTDGTIKAIMDAHDIHKRAVSVYQYFAGLALTDMFLIFEGVITSPIQWNEGDRTVKFSIVSRLEAQEIGFSADQGQFPFIPKNLVGKAWPIIFGTSFDVPALRITNAITGTLLCGVDLIGGANLHNTAPLGGDPSAMGASIAMMSVQASILGEAADAWYGIDDAHSDDLTNQQNMLLEQIGDTVAGWEAQQACALGQRQAQVAFDGPACNPIHILGGEDFPQNTDIVLSIKGALFFGRMNNDYFTCSRAEVPIFVLTAAQRAYNQIILETCPQGNNGGQAKWYYFQQPVPCGKGDFGNPCMITEEGFIVAGNAPSNPSTDQIAQQFWAEAGTQVTIAPNEQVLALINGLNDVSNYNQNTATGAGININSGQPITYIASITPGAVLAVKAYKTLHDSWDDHSVGQKQLVDLPSSYYKVSTVNYGPITATTIVTGMQLSSSIDLYGNNEGWDDELYVTFQSTIGPNIVDILIYIIENWTNGYGAAPNLGYDAASFATARTQLEQFPANFPLLEQRATMDVLKDIAFQARCALWISEGNFYIKYLPAAPTADDTITVSDIQHQSIVTELTPTEDLITKMFITWRISWANGNGETPDIIVLRNNIAAYGTQRASYDFYIYNQPDIILKAATFWLIRKSNTWKRIKFKTPLNKLNLETFDTVALNVPGYVANGEVNAVITSASYDSLENTVSFECECPVRSGELDQYAFYWPSSLDVTSTFPTPGDIAAGNGGGGGLAATIGGTLDIGYTGIIGVPGQPLNWVGEWASGVQYHVNDAVLWNGGAYVALAANINTDPGNLERWELITQINQTQGGTVFVGGPNVVFFGQADQGDKTPGDVGFQAQPVYNPTTLAQINNNMRPYVDLKLKYLSPYPAPPVPQLPTELTIDIHKTKIIDSNNPSGQPGYLKSLIKKIDTNGVLYLSSDLSVSDGTMGHDARFDFEFDTAGKIWGAGTAFLKDDTDPADEDTDEEDADEPDPGDTDDVEGDE